MRPLLLLVEDDPAIASTVVYALQREGFDVDHVLLLRDARERLAQRPLQHALVILDIGLPDGCGLDLCRELRHGGNRSGAASSLQPHSNTTANDSPLPILMLSARGEELDRVLGLELGADDYLVKPFSPRELAARIRALLRRVRPPAPSEVSVPWFHCDRDAARIRIGSTWLKLTRREFGLLDVLMHAPGKVWSREALLAAVWGDSADSIDRTVDTHIKTLRAKLREAQPAYELIATHRGLGYSIDIAGVNAAAGTVTVVAAAVGNIAATRATP